MAGKGDRNRTSDREAYRRNYSEVFNRCSKHPDYAPGKREPKCPVCKRFWEDCKELWKETRK